MNKALPDKILHLQKPKKHSGPGASFFILKELPLLIFSNNTMQVFVDVNNVV